TPRGRLPGTLYAASSIAGTHGSLSRYEMRNTLIAAGPDFKPGLTSKLPSANTDLAPTVAQILGLKPAAPFDGRVLTESLIDAEAPKDAPVPATANMQAKRAAGGKTWNQYLKVTTYQGRRYYDEGNVGLPPAK